MLSALALVAGCDPITPPGTIVLTPGTATVYVGEDTLIASRAYDFRNRERESDALRWRSSDVSVARVTNEGRVTGVAPGVASITATGFGTTATARVTVARAVAQSVIVSAAASDVAPGGTLQLTTVVADERGRTLLDYPVTWEALEPLIGTVSNAGIFTGRSPGNATVVARADGVAGSLQVRVTGVVEWASVSAGASHTCALSTAGVPYCWGQGSGGVLGNGLTAQRSAPTPVRASTPFRMIASGTDHSCGIALTGPAFCWGTDVLGTLGAGVVNVATAPIAVSFGFAYEAIGVGATHSCALAVGGVPSCWGSNQRGALGRSTTEVTVARAPIAPEIESPMSVIAVGDEFTCAVRAGAPASGGGTAYCWGRNDAGQTGTGIESASTGVAPVAGDLVFTTIATGHRSACGIVSAVVQCWGSNASGQLGRGTTSGSSAAPAPVLSEVRFHSVSVGTDHACAIAEGGAAYCWGSNASGQLGDGTSQPRATPTPVAGALAFAHISAGDLHTCGVTTARELYCWGANPAGQLGNPPGPNRPAPTRVVNP